MSDSSALTQSKIVKARTVNGIPPSAVQVPYKNIGDLLQQQVEKHASAPWLIYYSDLLDVRRTSKGQAPEVRRTYTYSEFYNLVCQTANLLLSKGVSRGDRVATVAYNHADTVIQYFAAWMIGAVVVPVNVGEDDKRIVYILQNSGTKLAFVRKEFAERMKRIIGEIRGAITIVEVSDLSETREMEGRGEKGIEFHSAIANCKSQIENLPDVSLEFEALIVYTSGTTGNPKGVVLTQYNLLIDAKEIAAWHGLKEGDRMMCVLPIHHVNGTVVTLMTPMYYGGSVVLNQKFHSNKFFERIANEHVQVVSVVPTLLQFLLHEHLDMPKYDLTAFRHIICGAGPLTVELVMKFESHFRIPIVHGYGLSETTCYSCFLPLDLKPEEHRNWLSTHGFPSIGVPIPCNEMAIHDEHGNAQPEGTKGEIVIRGHNVMKEYFANPEANEKTFAFGWFRSGDEGFYKTDEMRRKFFFITGRIKELIIRGGINISPFEIDEALMNMPGVKAGLVVGFDNDWYGEEVGAYIQTKEGVSLTEEHVIDYCRKLFPYQKCPKVVIFGNDIPVTSTGKYQRGKLKALFEKWKTIQFTERNSL